MPTEIEESLRKCKTCKKKTIHIRDNNRTSGLMIFVHLCLTLATMGVWLILLIVWMVLTAKIGGWTCKECTT